MHTSNHCTCLRNAYISTSILSKKISIFSKKRSNVSAATSFIFGGSPPCPPSINGVAHVGDVVAQVKQDVFTVCGAIGGFVDRRDHRTRAEGHMWHRWDRWRRSQAIAPIVAEQAPYARLRS